MMWLFSGAPEDPEDNPVMEKHAAEALYTAVKSLMHAIRTDHEEAQNDAAHRMIQIVKCWTTRRSSEWRLGNEKPLNWIVKENAHRIYPEWNGD